MITFTEWVLNQAKNKGIQRLYFLARDAYMSFLAAKEIVAARGLNIECVYLEGSRYAWRMAEFHLQSDQDILDKICIGGVHVTLRKLLRRGGLNDEEIEEVAQELGKADELDTQLTYAQTREYREPLAASALFLDLVLRRAIDNYKIAMEYFRQEGLLEDTVYAIVDSGWVGSLQKTLEHLVNSDKQSAKTIPGFYFGLYELPQGVDEKNYYTYYFRPYLDVERKVRFSNCLFEAVLSAPEGMTCGYEMRDHRVYPVKESRKNPNYERINANLKVLEQVVREHVECIQKKIPSPYLLEFAQVEEVLSKLMGSPENEEAKVLGNYLFSDDINAESLQQVACSLNRAEVKNTYMAKRFLLMKGYIPGKLKDSAWLEGSIVAEGSNIKGDLWHCRWYKRAIYLRKRIKGFM